jgi:serine/threonine protein kinase
MNRCARCSGEFPAFAVFCGHCGQVHEPDFDQLINLTIDGRYRINRRLGQGGLSTIFAATDLTDDSVVVIKISDPSQLARRDMSYAIDADHARGYWDEMLERMRREAETLAGIDHPNIVRFYGTGLINDDLRYVVMEFLRGRTLRDEIDRGGSLEESKAVAVALEITSALAEVHSRGIVHRDIHPRNIMIAECGMRNAECESQESLPPPETQIPHSAFRIPHSTIKLIDFGIAKFPQPPGAPPFTRRSTLAGAAAYASPEQCASQPVDHRSDIYSLGVVLYEMVTGERPFNGRTPTEIALKQIQSEPQSPCAINPAISASLERTILRALAKNPLDRQQSVEELSEELRTPSNRIVIPLAASADDQSDLTLSADRFTDVNEAESKLKLVRRRRRRLVVAAAAALVAVLASALLFGYPSFSLRHKSSDAAQTAGAGASPSPAVIGSDADSLELAANMSGQNNAGGTANAATQASPASTQQTQPANPTAANNAVSNRSAAGATIPPTPSPAPAPVPPRAQPQMPPAPSPDIAAARAPQPDSDPDLAQAPSRERDGGGWRRENETTNGNPSRSSNGAAGSDSDRNDDNDDREPNRKRNDDAGGYRRLPDPPNRGGRDDDDDDRFDRIGPKLIQWSGRVNYEREIKIEMPGVPGTVEIPRAYRDRVGIVEPPSAHNQWRCAVLRVFGRGGVSIVIRWWPAARNAVRFTARR